MSTIKLVTEDTIWVPLNFTQREDWVFLTIKIPYSTQFVLTKENKDKNKNAHGQQIKTT